ncbi:hypothetical protein [Streptomyces sp. NPDC059916]
MPRTTTSGRSLPPVLQASARRRTYAFTETRLPLEEEPQMASAGFSTA